jgi:hypothetical protein
VIPHACFLTESGQSLGGELTRSASDISVCSDVTRDVGARSSRNSGRQISALFLRAVSWAVGTVLIDLL